MGVEMDYRAFFEELKEKYPDPGSAGNKWSLTYYDDGQFVVTIVDPRGSVAEGRQAICFSPDVDWSVAFDECCSMSKRQVEYEADRKARVAAVLAKAENARRDTLARTFTERVDKNLSAVRQSVSEKVSVWSGWAEVEISNMVQTHRRSMGQRCRYAMERIEAVQ